MTNPNLRHITIVLDRSGSMQSVKADTEGGLKAFLEAQKVVPGVTRVTLRQFDTIHDTVFEDVPLAEVPAFELVPRGQTALLDAVGSTIARLGERLAATPEEDRPGEVIVVILTDGYENSSQEYQLDQIRQMITEQQDRYGWVFVFLGADQDAFAAGAQMGIRADTSLSYDSASTKAAMASAGDMVARASATGGDYGFTDDERNEAAK